MRFLCLFTLHQSVDAWRKDVNSASKVIMLRNNRNSSYRKIYLFRNKARNVNQKAVYIRFFVKKWKLLPYHLEDLRVPLVVRVLQVGNPCSNKYQNWATVAGGFLWLNELKSCKIWKFSYHSSRDGWWFAFQLRSTRKRQQLDCCISSTARLLMHEYLIQQWRHLVCQEARLMAKHGWWEVCNQSLEQWDCQINLKQQFQMQSKQKRRFLVHKSWIDLVGVNIQHFHANKVEVLGHRKNFIKVVASGSPRHFHNFLSWFKVDDWIVGDHSEGLHFERSCGLLDDRHSCAGVLGRNRYLSKV